MLTNGARGILAFADVEHVDFSVLYHCGTPLLRSQSQLLVGSVTKKPRRCRPKSKCLVWAVCVAGRMVPNEAGPYTSALAGLESFGPLLFVSKSLLLVLHSFPHHSNLSKHSMMSLPAAGAVPGSLLFWSARIGNLQALLSLAVCTYPIHRVELSRSTVFQGSRTPSCPV